MTDSADEVWQRYKSLPPEQRENVWRFIEQQAAIAKAAAINQQDSGKANRTHRVTGRLVFDDTPDTGQPKPLHNLSVELWEREFGYNDYLGQSVTDHDGHFVIWYDPRDAGFRDLPNIQLRVFDHDHVCDQHGSIDRISKLIYQCDGPDNVAIECFDFGQLAVPYWTYNPHTSLPRVHVVKHGSPPQSFSLGRAVMLVKHAAHVEFRHRLHHAGHRLNRNLPPLNKIQKSYPKNLTLQIERERPGYTRSDEYFGQRILNGMSASILDKDPSNLNRFWLHHHWNSYDQDDVYAMPSVDVWFELQDEQMMPVEIALQFRQCEKTEKGRDETMRFTSTDGERWQQAKRVARVSAALHAELDVHYAETHLNTEQYAMAAYRNLRRSPIRQLLSPHLKEVILINRDADVRLLGDHGYITQATALTSRSINQRVLQTMGTLDWKNWQPRQVLCPQHSYARAAHIFWSVLTEYIDWHFATFDEEIQEHWYEVHRFSDDLVQHSVPLYLCPYLRGRLDNDSGSFGDWFEQNERMDFSIPREVIDGVEKAILPVTKSDVCDIESLENMKQVCRYSIFHATFMHTWANSRQYDDGGELLYNGIGLRHGKDGGVLGPEDDHSIAPPPDLAKAQLWYAWMLSNSNYGFITKNEDRDIHPQFIRMLNGQREALAEVGLDINTLQSRVNI